jgi:hypothetical protein
VRHAVVAVLQTQSVPVHCRVQIAVIGDLDGDLAALLDLQRRPGNGAVVAQHPYGGFTQPLGHRLHAKIKSVAVGQLHDLRLAGFRES